LSNVEEGSFPFKDLARRRFQTGLTVLSLTICVSITVFLVLFGESLGVSVTSFTRGGLTVGFSEMFSKFIFVAVVLNSAAGILITYFLMKVVTLGRIRDIGVMKAVGCLTEVVYNYFGTELLMIVFLGCTLGTIGGIALNYASIGLMNLLGFPITGKLPNIWSIILFFFSFAFVSYVTGMRIISKAVGMVPSEALSPLFVWTTTHQPTSKLPFPSGKSFMVKMALRDLGRRRSITVQSVSSLSMIMILVTLATVGGIIARETTLDYVERANGKNVILVANAEMAEQYRGYMERFLAAGQKEHSNPTSSMDYLDEKYVIPNSFITELSSIDGVERVDPRLVLEATIYEYPSIRSDPDDPQRYVVIGDHRSESALIIGVHAEKLVNDWLILGENLSEASVDSALVGDSLALTLFQRPLEQSFKVLNTMFKVTGVCLDPLNNGIVVYIPFDCLSAAFKHTSYNLLLVQIDSSDPSAYYRILDDIEAYASGKGLTTLDLNETLGKQKALINYIWSLMLSLSLFSFVNAILALMGYLMLSISNQQKDLGIMRALGAKPKTVLKLILLETFLLVLTSGIIGLPIGTIIALMFFISEAVVSQTATLSIVGLLAVLIGALCLSSLYPARRIVKASITEAIGQI